MKKNPWKEVAKCAKFAQSGHTVIKKNLSVIYEF
jgi:hypothetical protein